MDRVVLRLVFTQGDDLFSVGVRALSLSPTSHVAIGFGGAAGAGGASSADHLLHVRLKKGVVLEPRKKWKQPTIAEFVVLRNVSRGLAFCLSQIGRPYDTNEVTERPILTLIRTIMPLAPVDNRTPGAWHCARFAICLDPNGDVIPEWRGLDPLTVTPGELYDRCLYGSSFMRVA